MRQARNIEGQWWIHGPDKPSVYGVLKYDPEEFSLLEINDIAAQNLFDFFSQEIDGKVREIPYTIRGKDNDDRHITLYGCQVHAASWSIGIRRYVISPLRILIGLESKPWKDVCFKDTSCEFSLLQNWIGRDKSHLASVCEGNFVIKVPTRFEIPIHQIRPGVNLLIRRNNGFGFDSEGIKIHRTHCVFFEFENAEKIEGILQNFQRPFRDMLTLFTGKAVYLDRLTFGTSENVELLMRNEGSTTACRSRLWADMLVQFNEIAQDLPRIICRWYQYYEQINSVLTLYFGTVFNRWLYEHQKFLFLAQALEVYHTSGEDYSSYIESKDEFSQRISRIESCMQASDAQWLKEKLTFANQKNLALRLDEILSKHSSEVEQFIPDIELFKKKVRHTRNYFTHYRPELKKKNKIANEKELPIILQQMTALLEICILKDLGIEGKPLQRVIAKTKGISIITLSD